MNNDDFIWDKLVDLSDKNGEDRLDSQFIIANIDPTMRYVQASVGTEKYRLATDDSGFDNLVLTGDWVKSGLNCGSLESTTIAGKQAARAVMDDDIRIWGEDGFDIITDKENHSTRWCRHMVGIIVLLALFVWHKRRQ